jgi:hypothetical protein
MNPTTPKDAIQLLVFLALVLFVVAGLFGVLPNLAAGGAAAGFAVAGGLIIVAAVLLYWASRLA